MADSVVVPPEMAGALARYAVRGIEADMRRNGALPALPPGMTGLLRDLATASSEVRTATGMLSSGEWITVAEAASRAGVSPGFVARLARLGRIRARRHGWAWLIDEAAVEDFARGRHGRTTG